MPPAPQGDVHTLVTAALTATQGESDTVKAAAINAVGAISPPGTRTANMLWLILVSVLAAVVLASAIGAVVYIMDNKAAPPDILITIFTTAFSGLIGLFVRPPASS
jgi:uncharacterized phage infection (PIP) family protein YhgE